MTGSSSVDRVFQLLEHLADVDGALSLSELAQLTDLPMPTIHRLLRSLVGQGYVQQEPSKRYALGPRLIRLGESASRNLGSWVEPPWPSCVAEFGETTNMAMLKGDACVYVAQVPVAAVDADVHRGGPGGHAALHRGRQGAAVHAVRRPGAGHPGTHRHALPDAPTP